MSVRQIIVLGVALLAAVGALIFVQGVARSRPAAAPAPTAAAAEMKVLVAARDLQPGAKIVAGDLEWRGWAREAMSQNFVSQQAAADAATRFVEEGRIVRQAMVAGEPIVEARLVTPGAQGFMAAMVSPGHRAVAVPITEETGAAGFILPDDRVDVMVTRKIVVMEVGGATANEVTRSGIVLQNVRVLAIDQTYKLDRDDEGEAVKGSVALLELSPRDAELLARADQLGDIALALRPIDASLPTNIASASQGNDVLQQFASGGVGVKIHSFGAVRAQGVAQGGQP
jgi:pilus assembly protein CpaB